MLGSQIKGELLDGKRHGKEFIKWWRKENDFADFDLIDRYLDNFDTNQEFDSFELLDKDQMWAVIKGFKPSGLERRNLAKGAKIEWQRMGKDGLQHTYSCPYNAHNMMSIFDTETRGDTLC